ncbi:MAG: 50S ribosomal protein L29 [Bacteroidetes bacterium]|nr:50S ribosomal protein L29 [Rhodothermaceae bacterium RA]RMH67009.1 MAG: 50S ribosomal protein L29 [Bacteroidota bacterium]
MKAKEIRELSTEEIAERIREEQEQLEQLRFQHAIARLENPMVLRQKRRLVARLQTILNERTRQPAGQ